MSCPRGCRALPPHFPRCSLGAFRLSPVRSDASVASLPQLWVPQSCCWAAQYLKILHCLPDPSFDCWASAADDLCWLWGSLDPNNGSGERTFLISVVSTPGLTSGKRKKVRRGNPYSIEPIMCKRTLISALCTNDNICMSLAGCLYFHQGPGFAQNTQPQ